MSQSPSQRAQVLPTYTPALFDHAVGQAVARLRAGEVVALPTETVYGLAANALDPVAVAKIFTCKGRPSHNPIIVHVTGVAMAQSCVSVWPEAAQKLAEAFWPGPLTLVLPRSAQIPDIVTAGGGTVGVRWPSHPFMQAVIKACGFPLAAPSANLSNEISPTNATHVEKSLGDKIGLIVDGGQSQVGIESAVLDVSEHPPRLLRPGMLHDESLLAVTGELAVGPGGGVLKSPGLLRKHYSPKARLAVVAWTHETELVAWLRVRGIDAHEVRVIVHTRIPLGLEPGRVALIPHDAEAFARAIYAELHHCDELGTKWIVVEELPEGPEWRGIADRLRRAAAE